MKANTLKTVFVLGSVLVAGLAMAQGGGAGGGQQRGGFGSMMSSPVLLIGRADVQKDIKLTDDQKAKLEALKAEFPMMNRGGNRGGGGGGGGQQGGGGGGQQGGQGGQRTGGGQGGGQVDMQAMQEMMKKAEAAIKEILTDEQETRIKQIGIQLGGAGVFGREDVQTELALTVDQKKSIMDLQQKQQQANGEMMQRVQNEEITRQEAMELRTKNDKILLEEIVKLLDQTQKDKYEAMKGPKFTPDPPQPRGGGNGGGN
jgi:hypothetical protein